MNDIVINGDITMQIVSKDKQVHILFNRPTEFIAFDAKNAVDVAMAMTDCAFEADVGLKPVGDTLKQELVDRDRATLLRRITLVLGSIRKNDKKTDAQVAQEIVDIVSNEIF